MRNFIGIALLTLFITSCKPSSSSGTQSSSARPNILPGSCTIGKWTNLSTPLNLKMSSEFSGDFTNADLVNGLNPLEQMAKVWNDAVTPTITLFQVPFAIAATTGSSSLGGFRDNELGIYKSHTWFPEVSSGALAITQYYGILRNDPTLGNYVDLTHADIIVNYRDFGSQFSMNGNSIISYDLPTVLVHEMGHFLGLCHENNYSSIMAPYYVSTQRALKTFDTNKIRSLYLNNQNYLGAIQARQSALSAPEGTPVKGIVELNANGKCRHYLNGKLTYEHDASIPSYAGPKWYKSIERPLFEAKSGI